MSQKEKNWLIFGGGFGLYGYLPAITISPVNKVYLNHKYKEIIYKRKELRKLSEKIIWYENINEIINNIDSVVMAIKPDEQPSIISKLINSKSITSFIIEKPIAATPKDANILISKLNNSKTNFVCCYSFLYTSWVNEIKNFFIKNEKEIFYINWSFKAYHFKNKINTWKSNHLIGGGVIRFYGIHLIALLAYFGYKNVSSSIIKEKTEEFFTSWEAIFTGTNLPKCKININSNSSSHHFKIFKNDENDKSNLFLHLNDPFDHEKPIGDFDKRVSLLRKVISDKRYQEKSNIYKDINKLWEKCEDNLIIK